MLNETTIWQVTARIDTINEKLKAEAEAALSGGKRIGDVLDQLTAHAVREFTPESKMLMSSIYSVLSKETLETEFFQVTAHEVAFNRRNIRADIADHFSFEVPDKIDFKADYNELLASGAITVVGGLVSIGMQSVAPISIAAVIAVIMYGLMAKHKKEDQRQLIDEYLVCIRDTLVGWLESIAEYYDQQVEALKRELERQGD